MYMYMDNDHELGFIHITMATNIILTIHISRNMFYKVKHHTFLCTISLPCPASDVPYCIAMFAIGSLRICCPGNCSPPNCWPQD